jgi:hypothetical protein
MSDSATITGNVLTGGSTSSTVTTAAIVTGNVVFATSNVTANIITGGKGDTGASGINGAKTATYVVATSGGDYTDIQSALDAIGTNGGTIYIADGTYTVTSTLLIKKARTTIQASSGATIQCNGATVTPLIMPNVVGLQNIIVRGGKWLQSNATASGTGFAFGDTPDAILSPNRIENFDLALDLTDANNLTFYNHYHDIQMFDNNRGILLAGNPVNNNTFTAIRIRPKAGGAGYGISIQNGRSNSFTGCDCEPATGTGITGLILGTNAHYNSFIGGWIENNDTNVTINSNANRNSFHGTNISSPLTTNISDPSTTVTTGYFAVNDNGTAKNNPASFSGTLLPNDINVLPGAAIRTRTAAGNSYSMQAWNTGSSAYKTFLTLTANATPTADLDDAVTKAGAYIYRAGGTTIPVADGGTGTATLTGLLVGNGTSAFTTVTAPSSAVVGISDTQTLTGKTLGTTSINGNITPDAAGTRSLGSASLYMSGIHSNSFVAYGASGITMSNGSNIIFNTATGTKIGTATTQKMGFYNATPVAQQGSTPAAATDLATALTLVNDLRTKLIALGLIA